MTNVGRLLVNVYDINMGRQVENAIIRIYDDNDFIAELITNASGKTNIISLPCPPKEYSLNELSNEIPYAKYNLEIINNGLVIKKIIGLEIFEDVTAIQNIFLNRSIREVQIITIREHTLVSNYPPKIPEDAIKMLPIPSGYIVLEKPVIPETIVVHDGPPNEDAKNYYIPFKEYIKNVACSEIYPTWPKEAIKANVLAIISFTLNRVYTEWYRNKGKNFTITSSTASDQAFSYGRNIFKEISVVVDEVFKNFVTKEGIIQPLLTQYCDGKKTQCPGWLSQFGSKYLADQGYSYINILKKYYGDEIFIEEAEKVEGIPKSFDGNNLALGTENAQVKIIQEQLNAISNNYPLIPKLKTDGIFGAKTKEAVEVFQETFDLPVTGIVNSSTWYKISGIYVAVKKLAEL